MLAGSALSGSQLDPAAWSGWSGSVELGRSPNNGMGYWVKWTTASQEIDAFRVVEVAVCVRKVTKVTASQNDEVRDQQLFLSSLFGAVWADRKRRLSSSISIARGPWT